MQHDLAGTVTFEPLVGDGRSSDIAADLLQLFTLIGYLTRTEMQALLAAPARSKWWGRRDYALLVTLYKSGARVSEVTKFKRE